MSDDVETVRRFIDDNVGIGDYAWNASDALDRIAARLEATEAALREIAEYSGMVNTEQKPVLMARAALAALDKEVG